MSQKLLSVWNSTAIKKPTNSEEGTASIQQKGETRAKEWTQETWKFYVFTVHNIKTITLL